MEHPKGKNFTVVRDPGGVGKETANGGRLKQTLFLTIFLHWFLIIGKTVSIVFKEYKIAME